MMRLDNRRQVGHLHFWVSVASFGFGPHQWFLTESARSSRGSLMGLISMNPLKSWTRCCVFVQIHIFLDSVL